jgi:hypothetical protein
MKRSHHHIVCEIRWEILGTIVMISLLMRRLCAYLHLHQLSNLQLSLINLNMGRLHIVIHNKPEIHLVSCGECARRLVFPLNQTSNPLDHLALSLGMRMVKKREKLQTLCS